jgi:hypothetical protein
MSRENWWWHLIADGMISRDAILKILAKQGANKTRRRPRVALSLTSRKQARLGREL